MALNFQLTSKNINMMPLLGWLFSLVLNGSLALPCWFWWTYWKIGQRYFPFLSEPFQSISYLDFVGFFTLVSIVKALFVLRLSRQFEPAPNVPSAAAARPVEPAKLRDISPGYPRASIGKP